MDHALTDHDRQFRMSAALNEVLDLPEFGR